MGLHGAAGLRQLPGEGGLQRAVVEAQHAAGRGHGAEAAGGGGPEEAKARPRRQPQPGRDIDADSHCRDQVAAGDVATLLGSGQRGGQDRCHCVHHGALVQAIVFLVVHLPGIEEGRRRRRQPGRSAPDGNGTAAPGCGHAQQAVAALDGGAGDADAEAIEHIDLDGLHSGGGQIGEACIESVSGEACGSGHAVE